MVALWKRHDEIARLLYTRRHEHSLCCQFVGGHLSADGEKSKNVDVSTVRLDSKLSKSLESATTTIEQLTKDVD